MYLRAESALRDHFELDDGEGMRRAHTFALQVVLTVPQALLSMVRWIVQETLLNGRAALTVVDVACLGQTMDEHALLVLGCKEPHELRLAVVEGTVINVELGFTAQLPISAFRALHDLMSVNHRITSLAS